MSSTIQALQTHEVVPDVLPDTIELTYDLTIKWANATLNTPGEKLDREGTQSEPKVLLSPEPKEKLEGLWVTCVDPDLLTNNDTNFGQIRHWLTPATFTPSPSSPFPSSNQLTIPQLSAQISPYIGPAPLPNYISPRPHRYIFILAQQNDPKGAVDMTSADLRELQKGYTYAVSGNQGGEGLGNQDLKDRWGFNVGRLMEMKGLRVLGATMMLIEGNLKGAGANLVMQGEAIVNKTLGR